MEGRRLVFADGTIIENGEAGYADGVLACFIRGKSIAEVFFIFNDPDKARRIVFQYGEMQDVYEGFTQIAYLLDGDRISVGLRRPE